MTSLIGFYLLAATAVLGGIALVSARNLFHAALGLAVASLAIAGLMLTVSAEFLAWVTVLVYVGAVVVLAVFAIMLTGHFDQGLPPSGRGLQIAAALVSLALAGILVGVALVQPLPAGAAMEVTTRDLGRLLLTDYVLPFELVSVLLLAALIGAIVIARKRESEK